MRTLEEMIGELPVARRKTVAKRAAVLIAEEMTLRELRKARRMTQVQMAKQLGVKQEQISRIEKRTDIHLSTLRRSVEAMGGELTLTATFPNSAPVQLIGFSDLDA